MSPTVLADFLLTCLFINYGVLLVWLGVFTRFREPLYRLHHQWFPLTPEAFAAVHYQSMALYKIGVLLLNLSPWLALQLMA
jgi:hypothetical protein